MDEKTKKFTAASKGSKITPKVASEKKSIKSGQDEENVVVQETKLKTKHTTTKKRKAKRKNLTNAEESESEENKSEIDEETKGPPIKKQKTTTTTNALRSSKSFSTKKASIEDKRPSLKRKHEDAKDEGGDDTGEIVAKSRGHTKVFAANGDLIPAYHYYVDPSPWNELNLRGRIERMAFTTLVAPSQSGKSTRAKALIESLRSEFELIMISAVQGEAGLVSTLKVLLDCAEFEVKDEKELNMDTFRKLFGNGSKHFRESKVVLIIDELDALCTWRDEDRSSFLDALRAIKNSRVSGAEDNTKTGYVLQSVLGITNYVGDYIHTRIGSPFNVDEKITAPYFSFDETKDLFRQYEQETGRRVNEEIVEHIYAQSGGAQGITQTLGKYMDELYQENDELNLDLWKQHYESTVISAISRSANFQKMKQGLNNEDVLAGVISIMSEEVISADINKQNRITIELQRYNICILQQKHVEFANPIVQKYIERSFDVTRKSQSIDGLFSDDRIDFRVLLCEAIKCMNRISIIKGTKLAKRKSTNVEDVYVEAFYHALKRALPDIYIR
ncbi:Lon protease [Acrasis kona]|uniref:Lon protease n=1 Tax=Acrasis kona TaxID=1008807 RepID=A0AAW2ZRF1_9EUKA